MADFPGTPVAPHTISVLSQWAGGGSLLALVSSAAGSSGTWPGANRAIYVPIIVSGPFKLNSFFSSNGSAVAGNIDMGIFGVDGSLITSTGSTAQAGTSTLQIITVTERMIAPGRYYIGLSASSTSATFINRTPSVLNLQRCGLLQAATQVPLATLPTWATPASAYIPYFGCSQLTTY